MTRPRRKKLKSSINRVSFHRLIPNLATVAALCIGMSSVRFALVEKWETAVSLVLVAALLDGMDGRLARMLGSVSRFGAQLDSLSDFVSFGIAPAFILYHFSLKNLCSYGWAASLIFAVCMALRLARFNTQDETPSPLASLRSLFFTGIPAPAAGILGLFPVILWCDQKLIFAKNPWFVGGFAIVVSSLMISRIPTFAFKKIKLSQSQMLPLMVLASVVIAITLSAPWKALIALCTIYLFLIPFSARQFQSLKNELEVEAAPTHE
ncbi:MAG: CDP-diacylglycerol--serine O-phosphatidyltransferase [Alphaproteobacteria bacterium]|nr:CDP-diacylglycerol--serine O-phosphatidyltransferase [Alphaproteobacteria bacterium]OJV47545.1 MAG: CDP-diacylglycerol--serine O-phosphatidyltransferase [Alphaproteobacteria bacterium 43-37]